jgi:hypothetical protein
MNIAEKTLQLKQDFDDVYDAGKKAESDAFWDMFQDSGKRTTYSSAFYNWSAEYIRPKYKVIPTHEHGVGQMFNSCKKLKKIEAAHFDLSQKPQNFTGNTNFGYYYTFNSCSQLEEIEDIGMIAQNHYNYAFAYCSVLHTIAKMGVDANTKFSNTFTNCKELINLTIDGIIGQNGFDIHWSTKLSADSLKSIINALSTTTTGLTITLPTTAQANYEMVYGSGSWNVLTATRSNWSIAYA